MPGRAPPTMPQATPANRGRHGVAGGQRRPGEAELVHANQVAAGIDTPRSRANTSHSAAAPSTATSAIARGARPPRNAIAAAISSASAGEVAQPRRERRRRRSRSAARRAGAHARAGSRARPPSRRRQAARAASSSAASARAAASSLGRPSAPTASLSRPANRVPPPAVAAGDDERGDARATAGAPARPRPRQLTSPRRARAGTA